MKAIRWYLRQAQTDALAVVYATDAVWLKRDIIGGMDMYNRDVHVYNRGVFRYDVIGYTGYNRVFHDEVTCPAIAGEPKRIPETKALKWDYTYCEECSDRGSSSD